MDDAAQLKAIAAGDADAFAQWLAGAEPRVRASLMSWAAVLDVEAVLQETLLRVWQVAPGVTPHAQGETLLRLSVRIARNLAIDLSRKRRAVVVDAPTLEALTERCLEVAPSDSALRERIGRCRDRLPSRPRAALEQRLASMGCRADHELAAQAGMRLNTFLQNLSRARRLLRDCLTRAGVEVLT